MEVPLSKAPYSIPFPVNESVDSSSPEKSHRRKTEEARRKEMESRLEVLHALRCILGPLVESIILLDRLAWIREELEARKDVVGIKADLINLFDQAIGSGRNIAILVA